MAHYKAIDEYIQDQPAEVARRLSAIRKLFHKLLPNTEESVRCGLPAFTVAGYHLYISVYKNHIGMYPIPMYGIPELDSEMLAYRGEGTKRCLALQAHRALANGID